MSQDDFGNELLDEQAKDEYQLAWCLAEAEEYISKHGMEKFLSELRKRIEQWENLVMIGKMNIRDDS